eukprot:c2641_g1_i2.p1 GENE.c2641_g1_i2~~c2641_g1_i2.p1  ORF type:complete len:178 (+),score=11.59 c2641_g1_i2:2-535(+)
MSHTTAWMLLPHQTQDMLLRLTWQHQITLPHTHTRTLRTLITALRHLDVHHPRKWQMVLVLLDGRCLLPSFRLKHPRDHATGKSRGFGFVTFRDSQCVDRVVATSPHVIGGRRVSIDTADPRLNSGGRGASAGPSFDDNQPQDSAIFTPQPYPYPAAGYQPVRGHRGHEPSNYYSPY